MTCRLGRTLDEDHRPAREREARDGLAKRLEIGLPFDQLFRVDRKS